jgi:iron complex outermembrane recepter protein
MRNLLLVGFCLSFLFTSAQTGSINGMLRDAINQYPIAMAEIKLIPGNYLATTDGNGMFQFQNIPFGKYEAVMKTSECILRSTSFELKSEIVSMLELFTLCNNDQIILSGNVDLDEVVVEATRATNSTPMTFTNISKSQIESLNTAQDIPQLLRYTPSLVSTSDAGNGVGYSGLWIRGSDPSRINVTVNGIPMNDPESQQVFWVNTPDLASSANNIQIQRGIGTSANGAASFGGNIKIETRGVENSAYAETKNSIGSFNTIRNTINFGTGLIDDHFVFEGRLSRIKSDGYIDRATSDLKSFFFEGNYIGSKTNIKLNMFGGRETTFQSWNGTPESILQNNQDSILAYAERNGLNGVQLSNMLNSGRTYNFYDYENQVDNYGQDHYQAHVNHQFNSAISLNLSGHYTHGEGYFEEFKADQDYESYGLKPALVADDTIYTTDLVRRRWLKNNFYGLVGAINYRSKKFESTIGGAFNEYIGNHFGEIFWMQYSGDNKMNEPYYKGRSVKHDGNVYAKGTYKFNDFILAYADMQIRSVIYNTNGTDNDLKAYDVRDEMLFFNPKFGMRFNINNQNSLYASIAKASKEPNRNDYIDAIDFKLVKPEEMIDFETGYEYRVNTSSISVNAYNMQYKNQLVLTGELNDVGAPLRMNVAKSYRRGIELQAAYSYLNKIFLSGNATFSQNKIESFEETIYDYTIDYEVKKLKHDDTDISFSPSLIAAGNVGYRLFETDAKDEFRIDWFTKYVGKQFLDNTQNDNMMLDPYLVNDLKIGFTSSKQRKVQFEVSAFVHNILDELYSSNGYTYSYIYETRITETFFYPQAGRNYSVVVGLRF